ncbi:MAG: hypothetical protein C0516_14915 [Gemmatimonas sp.]|nr:hypothetical protein [Gemmatimonas sp.]
MREPRPSVTVALDATTNAPRNRAQMAHDRGVEVSGSEGLAAWVVVPSPVRDAPAPRHPSE